MPSFLYFIAAPLQLIQMLLVNEKVAGVMQKLNYLDSPLRSPLLESPEKNWTITLFKYDSKRSIAS